MKFPISLPRIPIKLPPKVTQALGKLALKANASKPGGFIVGGIVLGGAAIFFTAKGTWDKKDDISNDVKAIKAVSEKDKNERTNEEKEQLTKAKKQLVVHCAEAYWKPAVMGGVSVFLILHGKKLYKKQIVELSTMYATLLESYRRYRNQVIKEYGAEKDQEFMYGLKTIETVDAETGEIETKTIQKEIAEYGGSPYARYLTEGIWDNEQSCYIWENHVYRKNKWQMESILRSIQAECNSILRARGWISLNDVYAKLGLPPTKAGQHVGWVRGGIYKGVKGNDFIDFGVFPDEYGNGTYQLPINILWMDKTNTSQIYPLLDFNVIPIDGIFDDIYEHDSHSNVAYAKRKQAGFKESEEFLDRFWAAEAFHEQGDNL